MSISKHVVRNVKDFQSYGIDHFRVIAWLLLVVASQQSYAQDSDIDDSTVVYPAAYFNEYAPVTAHDMLDRIPGINIGGGPRGGNASNGGRGLGSGGGGTEVLINGKRTAGKSNDSQSQLSRISADQVDYVEIIRGTSGDLDVRGSTQIVNIVLYDSLTRTSLSYEANVDYYADGEIKPGGSLSYGGQTGALNFLISAEAEPRYQHTELEEHSVLADQSPNDLIFEDRIRKQTNYSLSTNLNYQFNEKASARFNALYEQADNPTAVDRTTIDVRNGSYLPYVEREEIPGTEDSWEIGGDVEYRFDNDHRIKLLGIANQKNTASTRERFEVFNNNTENKNLFLDSASVLEERIVRGSYTMGLFENQDIEIGLEHAQTTLDSRLRLGLDLSTGTPSPNYGGLVPYPVTNANTKVEEVRYEPFAIHNWTINARMSLETSLVYESSEITQSGDSNKQDEFEFFKPKLDYRFDITPAWQLRLLVEKVVRQLSFSDYVASTDSDDNDANTQAGNNNLRPDYWWNYNVLTEYRLPNDSGVITANLYKHRHYDFRQRIDVSPSDTDLQSAWGNTGIGEMWVFDLRASVRMTMFNMPDTLVTSRASRRISDVRDPFTGENRTFNNYHKGDVEFGFRHDIPKWKMNYGLNYRKRLNGDNRLWDLEDIETTHGDGFGTAFVEVVAFNDVTFRLDSRNIFDGENCRDRVRFVGRRSDGIVEEKEYMCNGSGRVITFRVSGRF